MLTPVHQDWSYPTSSTITAWPSGSVSGDLAVVIIYPAQLGISFWTPYLVNPPAGWVRAGTLFDSAFSGFDAGFGYFGHVFYQRRTAAAPKVSLYQGFARMITIPGAFGVGSIRNGIRRATVKPNGGVIVISEIGPDTTPDDDFAGATLLAGQMSVTVGSNTYVRSRVAWASSGSAALIGVTDEAPFSSADDAITLEILPPIAPLAPTVVAPVSGSEVSSTSAVVFSWAHNPVIAGGSQDAYRLRLKAVSSGTWLYYDLAGDAMVSGETSNATATTTLSRPHAGFTASTQYEVQVATRERIDQQWSPYSGSSTFTPVTAPTLTITSPGSWSGDLTPTITWTRSTPRGTQTAWRVLVSTTPAHDSGWRTGSNTSTTLPVLNWVNGTPVTLTAYIRQTGGSESLATTQALTVSWTAPNTPVVTATPTTDGGTVLGVSVASAPLGAIIDIERQLVDDPEETWTPVLSTLYPASGTLTTADILAPYGLDVTYRARAVRTIDGVPLRSAWGTSTAAASIDAGTYLVNDGDRADWLRVVLTSDNARAMKQDTYVNYGKGDPVPYVTYEPAQGFTGTTTLKVPDETGLLTLRGWLTSDRNMLLRRPPKGGTHVAPRLFARTSLTEDAVAQSILVGDELVTFDWVSQ